MAILKNILKKIIDLPQPLKYFIIGGFTVIVDLGLYNVLSVIFDINIFIARVFSLATGFTAGYFLHKKITFVDHNKHIANQITRYYLIALVGFALNFLVMKIIVELTNQISVEVIRKNIPVIVAIGIVFFWNYYMQKHWTFKDRQSILKIG